MKIQNSQSNSSSQPSLFETLDLEAAGAVTAYRRADAPATELDREIADSVFVSDVQKRIIATNQFYYIFAGKSLEEIEEIHRRHSGKMFRESEKTSLGAERLEQWYDAMFAAETVALEKEYRSRDGRFLTAQKGTFWLIPEKGQKQLVEYHYQPGTGGRNVPNVQVIYKSDAPSEISTTGYYSHYGNFAFAGGINSLEEYIEAAARARGAKSQIVFNRQSTELAKINS